MSVQQCKKLRKRPTQIWEFDTGVRCPYISVETEVTIQERN